jgi:uncharacterized protein YciW
MTDIIGALIGAPDGSHVAGLRAQRPEILAHTQGYHDVLLSPGDPGGLGLPERAAIALRAAELANHPELTAHYRALAAARGPVAPSPRWDAALAHAEMVATAPAQASRARIDALRALGWAPRDIVALTQIVAYVAYQTRAARGLALLVRSPAP